MYTHLGQSILLLLNFCLFAMQKILALHTVTVSAIRDLSDKRDDVKGKMTKALATFGEMQRLQVSSQWSDCENSFFCLHYGI